MKVSRVGTRLFVCVCVFPQPVSVLSLCCSLAALWSASGADVGKWALRVVPLSRGAVLCCAGVLWDRTAPCSGCAAVGRRPCGVQCRGAGRAESCPAGGGWPPFPRWRRYSSHAETGTARPGPAPFTACCSEISGRPADGRVTTRPAAADRGRPQPDGQITTRLTPSFSPCLRLSMPLSLSPSSPFYSSVAPIQSGSAGDVWSI